MQNIIFNLFKQMKDQQFMSGTRKMRQEFAISIRREKRDEIFRQFRSKLRNEFILGEQQKMTNILTTHQAKEEWINRKARQLEGIPEQNWRYILNELNWSLLCFRQKGCFKIWISNSIVKNISVLFAQEYSYLGLGPEAAKLFANMIYMEIQNEEDQTSLVAQQLLKLQIVPSVIRMAQDMTLPYNQISYLITLIGNLFLLDAQYMLKRGAFTVCVSWSLRMLKEQKLNRSYLSQLYDVFDIIAKNSRAIPKNYNFSNQIFRIFTQFIQIDQNDELIQKNLRVILKLLLPKKQAIYQDFMGNRKLFSHIFQLSIHPAEQIRQLCWHIFSYVSSATAQMSKPFIESNFIDYAVRAYQIQPKPNGISDKITQFMLLTMTNIAAQSDFNKQMILNSPALNIILDSCHPQRSMNLIKQAYYSLVTLTFTDNFNLLMFMIYQTPIYEKLAYGLDSLVEKDARTVKDIIASFYHAVCVGNKLYRQEGVLQFFEARYSLIQLLQRTEQKYHRCEDIVTISNQILDLAHS